MKPSGLPSLFVFALLTLFTSCNKKGQSEIISPWEHEFQSIRNDTNITDSTRLAKINSFLTRAKRANQRAILYKSYLLKTTLHDKLKQLDSAIYYSQELLDLTKIKKDSSYISRAYAKLGRYYKIQNQIPESFEFHDAAFNIQRDLGDSIRAGKSLYELSKIQKNIGDFPGSLETAVDALDFIEDKNEPRTIFGLYHNIAVVLREQGKDSLALDYVDKAWKLYERQMDSNEIRDRDLLVLQETKANLWSDRKEYSKAIDLFNLLLQDSITVKNKSSRARTLSNLGHTLWLQNKRNEESEELLIEAHSIRDSNDYVAGLIASNMHLAYYYEDVDKEKSIDYAENAYKKAQSRNGLLASKEALELLIKLKENSTLEGRAYAKIDRELKDIMGQTRDIYAATRFQNEGYQERVINLEADNKQKETERTIYLLGAVLVILLATVLIRQIYVRNNKDKVRQRIKVAHQTENLFAKKVHDELANDMADTLNYVEHVLELPKDQKTKLAEALEDLYQRTRNIAAETAGINESDFAQSLKSVLMQHNVAGVKVVTNPFSVIDWNRVPDYKKMTLYRCLQELMINMKRHSRASQVTIIFKNNGNKNEIRYIDNGIGTSMEQLHKRGLRNVETRMHSIGGRCSFDTAKGAGFRATLSFTT